MKRAICFSTLALSCLGTAIAIASAVPQDQSQKPDYTLAEYNAFQATQSTKNVQDRITSLNNFSSQYPDSALMPFIDTEFYLTYFSLQDYPKAVAYADKFLAFPDSDHFPSGRMAALETRAMAYAAGCDDSAFQTREASVEAMNAAAEGLHLLGQLPEPSNQMTDSAKIGFEMTFDSEATIAELNLKGDPVVCTPPPRPQAAARVRAVPNSRFDLIIQHLLAELRETPSR